MTKNQSSKWILTRLALPVAAVVVMLAGCKENASDDNGTPVQITIIDKSTAVIDSLLKENNKLTDSLKVVNDRLNDCESARTKRCPHEPNTGQKKPKQTKPVKTSPVQKPAQPTHTVTQPAASQVIAGDNKDGNSTVIIGNNNNVNNIIINDNDTVIDTLTKAKTVRIVVSGYAKKTYTYTK